MSVIRLADDQLERLADLIAERLQPPTQAAKFVDAKTRAAQLDVSEEYVRRHWQSLGGLRIGDGSKPRLRFGELPKPVEPPAEANTPVARPRRLRRARDGGVRLLPIKGETP